MDDFYFVYHIGLFGISYLYWAILAFFVALVSLFIRIPPFALPQNPSNWMLKKLILHYFHSTAWIIIAWVCFRLYRRDGEFTTWLSLLTILSILLLLTFMVVWMIDRFRIRKMKEKYLEEIP